ncbi:hypothetical protein LDENG_00039250 [Lucifuga dentata]|nr:hypothetical protein LDENG_00039250 [Lucifuga dentata]
MEIPVKVGGSISVPCLYEPRYINHVKYLCEGFTWSTCSYVVRTDNPGFPGGFLISDDTKERIFTVTINNLEKDDTDFWCVVEIPGALPDVGQRFWLSPTESKTSEVFNWIFFV